MKLFIKLVTAFAVSLWAVFDLADDTKGMQGVLLIKVTKMITLVYDPVKSFLTDEHERCFVYNIQKDLITSHCSIGEVNYTSNILSDDESCGVNKLVFSGKAVLAGGDVAIISVGLAGSLWAISSGYDVRKVLKRLNIGFMVAFLALTGVGLYLHRSIGADNDEKDLKSLCEEKYGGSLKLFSEPILFVDLSM